MSNAKRSKLFEKQKGLCYYCNNKVKLVCYGKGRRPIKDNEATIEHLYSVYSGKRNNSDIVLACKRCNSYKNKLDELEAPLEVLRKIYKVEKFKPKTIKKRKSQKTIDMIKALRRELNL